MFARPLLCPAAALALLWLLTAAPPAGAQQNQARQNSRDDAYFAGKLLLGVAGNAELGALDDDLELSYGLGFAYMHPLHRYFVLGAQIGVQSWQTETGDDFDTDRNVFADLTVVPQGRLPITRNIEIYLALPIGLTLDFFNGADALGLRALGMLDTDPALGFTLSLLAGARFALSDSFGLLTELGYTLHSFSHGIDLLGPAGGGVTVANVDVHLEQLALNVGVFF